MIHRGIGRRVYVNDIGTLALSLKDIDDARDVAESGQQVIWKQHQDDLIGVPEIELWCNVTTAVLDAKIERLLINEYSR